MRDRDPRLHFSSVPSSKSFNASGFYTPHWNVPMVCSDLLIALVLTPDSFVFSHNALISSSWHRLKRKMQSIGSHPQDWSKFPSLDSVTNCEIQMAANSGSPIYIFCLIKPHSIPLSTVGITQSQLACCKIPPGLHCIWQQYEEFPACGKLGCQEDEQCLRC